jgi:acyl carrier protein
MGTASTERVNDRDIAARLHEFILAKFLEGEQSLNLTKTTPLVTTGIIDSVSSLQVGLFLERTFSIKITPEELSNPETMETIASITALVRGKLQSRV